MSATVLHRYHRAVLNQVDTVRAGVDWISCTLGSEAPMRWEWANECTEVLIEISKKGHKIGDWGINGYRGVLAGGSFVGNREDSTYCQLSGHYASDYLDRIMRHDLHISRLDLAVTVQFRTMPKRLGALAFAMAQEADRDISPSRRRKIWYMSGSDGGYTLYIGAPTSDQRGRLYNKEVQSGTPEYARSWRYETVYRNDRAMAVFKVLFEAQQSDREGICGDLVEVWYKSRGVHCPWTTATNIIILPQIAENPSDATKKLKWLGKQVRPALDWLIENGYRKEALQELGIGE